MKLAIRDPTGHPTWSLADEAERDKGPKTEDRSPSLLRSLWALLILSLAYGHVGAEGPPLPSSGPAEMILIPAGEFTMGSDKGQADELPVHRVYLDAYYIDKYEVTNGAYFEFWIADGGPNSEYPPRSFGVKHNIGDWPEVAKTKPNYPVVGMGWRGAEAYCRWADKRLPTEAEWEKAVRGTDGRRFPWGDQWEPTMLNSWIKGALTTTPVGSYPQGASPYGVMDMMGNVWEWCADWYDPAYYTKSPRRNPRGPPEPSDSEDKMRVIRGGSWTALPIDLRCANRDAEYPGAKFFSDGFRCVRDATGATSVVPDTWGAVKKRHRSR